MHSCPDSRTSASCILCIGVKALMCSRPSPLRPFFLEPLRTLVRSPRSHGSFGKKRLCPSVSSAQERTHRTSCEPIVVLYWGQNLQHYPEDCHRGTREIQLHQHQCPRHSPQHHHRRRAPHPHHPHEGINQGCHGFQDNRAWAGRRPCQDQEGCCPGIKYYSSVRLGY